MKIIVQRVSSSFVKVDDVVIGSIGQGLNLLIGISISDTREDALKLIKKICSLRLWDGVDDSSEKKWNRSIKDLGSNGGILAVSQFTLQAKVDKGAKPDFHLAMPPMAAKEMFEYIVSTLKNELESFGTKIETGSFGALMEVYIVNDGPVTIILDSNK